jgi:hypothetical protein
MASAANASRRQRQLIAVGCVPPGCAAFGIPRRLGRTNFHASGPAAYARAEYFRDGERLSGRRWERPTHVGMVADHARIGDMCHRYLSICSQ